MNLEMVGGFDQTNLLISIALVMILIIVSRIRKILNESGTWAAAVLGLGVAIGGHWTWLVTLLAFLSAGFFVTRWRYEEKRERGFNEGEDGERDWTNVLSNGGVPLLISLYAFVTEDWQGLLPIFVASVAVATSDTFASEVGCLDKRVYMITTMKKCEPGLNGGFSPNGQMAALAGALGTKLEKIEHYSLGTNNQEITSQKVKEAITLMKVTSLLFFGIVSIPIILFISLLESILIA